MRHRSRLLPCLLVALLAGCAVVDKLSGEGEAKRIRRVGTSAEALVLGIEDTGVTLNDNPVVAFHLEVRPAGRAPYEARTRGVVGRLDVPRIQPGAVVPVAVDPADPQRVALRLYRDR
ncbi:hypothetical protein TBR22_A01460 [Luteitalea sp. TBR-22]|uniref:DUF3592 domain-containing protein n=1 Tax=Luteitalea sp. TBR-22 TaxID=2802971 RepID=UPI001AFCB250|nr:DUF3592 domain-containing protein [Luteitalea sp. TBR-22]BCS30945.1 hypothetical protein TBR22_A01460 [Luteitalea sp. TBR-22]